MGRARGGVKVPNVKLRPAETSKAPSTRRNVIDSDEEDQADDTYELQGPRAIFRGVILCATGIKDKRTIFDLVRRMGGTHSTDFTDATTHLVASEPGSEKYRCALERGVPVVTPSWIYGAHDRWKLGENFSVESTIPSHRLLPFIGVRICVTGIEVADIRNRIHKLTKANGGEYLKSLDKTCTHLLCAAESSPKVDYANRVNAEREVARGRADGGEVPPSIEVLWEEWFWDCIHVGGRLQTEPYHIVKPRPEPMSRSVMHSPEVARPSLPPPPSVGLPEQLPLSSLLADAKDTAAPTKVIRGAALSQWNAITGSRGAPATSGFAPSTLRSSHVNRKSRNESSSSPVKKTWASGSFDSASAPKGYERRSPKKKTIPGNPSTPTRVRAFPITAAENTESNGKTANGPSSTFLSKFSRAPAFSQDQTNLPSKDVASRKELGGDGIFSGATFRAMGDAACDVVFSALERAGGTLLQAGSPDYYIVRLVGGSDAQKEFPLSEHAKFRTECWLERCLFENRICPVEDSITCVPLTVRRPIKDHSSYLVAFSGLDTFDATWVARLLRLLEIPISPAFSMQCTHLICPSREGVKYQKAKEWGIPVVDFEWLTGLARTATDPDVYNEPDSASNVVSSIGDLKIGTSMANTVDDSMPVYSPVFGVTSPGRSHLVRPPSPGSPTPTRKQAKLDIHELAQRLGSGTGTPKRLLSPNEKAAAGLKSQRVPSSVTPSPIPLTTQLIATSKRYDSNTPTIPFFDVQSASAKNLTKSIDALLGSKRGAEEDPEVASSSAPAGQGRARKRPRAPSSKRTEESPCKKLALGPLVPNFENEHRVHHDDNWASATSPVKGIAVNYADPLDADERRRLQMLVDNEIHPLEEEQVQTKASRRPRRSTRPKGT